MFYNSCFEIKENEYMNKKYREKSHNRVRKLDGLKKGISDMVTERIDVIDMTKEVWERLSFIIETHTQKIIGHIVTVSLRRILSGR